MSALPLRASAPVGVGVLLSSAAAVSALILWQDPDVVPKILLATLFSVLVLIMVWRFSRVHRLTLGLFDEIAWAVLIAHTVIVARIRDPKALAEEGGFTAEILTEIAIWCLCIAYATGRLLGDLRRLRLLAGRSAKFTSLFFLLAASSAYYALGPLITIAWTIKLASILLLACVLFDPREPEQSCERFASATLMGFLLMLGQFVVLGAISPESAYVASDITGIVRLGGFLIPATQLSTVGGISFVLLLVDRMAGRRFAFDTFLLIASFVFMFAALGRGGMLATAVATIIILVSYRKTRLALAVGGALLFIFLLVPGSMDLSWEILTRRQQGVELTTLTGRVPLWEKVVELIGMKPFLGWGYVSGGRLALLTMLKWWAAPHAHNAFLEILLSLGAVGGVILLGLLTSIGRGLASVLRAEWSAESPTTVGIVALKVLALVALLTVDGLFTAGYSGAPRFETVTLFGAAFCVDQLNRVRRTAA